jgi:hypothetical protein
MRGYLPNQKILGKFSYPSHTYDEFDVREIYQEISRVVGFKEVVVDFNGKVRTEITLNQWLFKRDECD